MASFQQLRSQALEIARASHDPQVGELARIIEQICAACADLAQQVVAAQADASRAKRAAKS